MNLDRLQKTLGERLADIWPPLYYVPKILRKDGPEFLAVLIPGSSERPYFAGHSYVRVGSETKKAAEEQFEELILQRSSKGRGIEKMIGKQITWEMFRSQHAENQRRGDTTCCHDSPLS